MNDTTATPAAIEPSPGSTPPAAPAPGSPPPAATRPDFLPEKFWDAKAGAINTDEFGKHYGELTAAQQKLAERTANVPAKPDDYKFTEVKLPETVKVPEGVSLKIDDKDPRVPLVRAFAHKFALPQEAVNELVALDAQMKIEAHNASMALVTEETGKLGENAKTRRDAVSNWANGLVTKGDLSKDEAEEIRLASHMAAGVSLFEKLMAKLSGSVPGSTQETPRVHAVEKTFAERMYPNLPSGLPPASARSA